MSAMVFFHNPDEENGYLSNWFLSDFTAGGVAYSSMEQYMMHRKALLFGDEEAVAGIMATTDVAKIKALGRGVTPYDDTIWNGMRQIIIYEGLLEKFRQNDDLRARLLATGDKLMAECAVQDKVWGIGLSMTDQRRHDISQWRGQNLLGFALMQVREKFR